MIDDAEEFMIGGEPVTVHASCWSLPALDFARQVLVGLAATLDAHGDPHKHVDETIGVLAAVRGITANTMLRPPSRPISQRLDEHHALLRAIDPDGRASDDDRRRLLHAINVRELQHAAAMRQLIDDADERRKQAKRRRRRGDTNQEGTA